MKLLFLDIDGVLNCSVTKERWNGLTGIDRRLASMLLQWLSGKDVGVVLSSTWRLYEDTKEHLAAAGLSWIGQTPNLRTCCHRTCAARGRRSKFLVGWAKARARGSTRHALR